MKLIKYNYVNTIRPFIIEDSLFSKFEIIKNNYKFELSDKPDIVFYGCFGDISEISKFPDAVRIFIISEPISCDFSLFDYCLSFEPYDFGGRNCFFPDFIYSTGLDIDNKNVPSDQILADKILFCDFIYKHETDGMRKHYYDLLNSYKRVESAGIYLNNQINGKTVNWGLDDNSKVELQKKCKFSLCLQSVDYDYFINEKIVHSLYADEIPIFWGTEKVIEFFNPKRIICVKDYKNDKELLDKIIEIDNNDDLFLSIIREPIFNSPNFQTTTIMNAVNFLYHILESLPNKRRCTIYKSNDVQKQLERYRLINTKIHFFKKCK